MSKLTVVQILALACLLCCFNTQASVKGTWVILSYEEESLAGQLISANRAKIWVDQLNIAQGFTCQYGEISTYILKNKKLTVLREVEKPDSSVAPNLDAIGKSYVVVVTPNKGRQTTARASGQEIYYDLSTIHETLEVKRDGIEVSGFSCQ